MVFSSRQSFWLKLLNISAENLFEVSQSATLLTSAVQGGLQSLGQLLIQRGVSLDVVDGAGLSAIMYSLIYNDEVITQDLINRLAQLSTSFINHYRNLQMLTIVVGRM